MSIRGLVTNHKLFCRLFFISAILFFALTACASEPNDSLLVQTTETLVATSTIIPTPVPTPSNEPVLPELTGYCAHPYFPAIEGRKLSYRSESLEHPEFTIEFVDVSEEAFAIQVDMKLDTGKDLSVDFNWTCSPEGILSLYFWEGLTGIQGLLFDMQEASGITLIGASKMVLGAKWTTEYSIHDPGSVETPAGVLNLDTTVRLDHTVVEIEPISVIADDYSESYRVDTVGTYKISLSLGNEVMKEEVIDLFYKTWYVENIGIVRQEFVKGWSFEPSDAISVTELISIE